jgi:pimeloyl-ACP methyl ester carboxylesterase
LLPPPAAGNDSSEEATVMTERVESEDGTTIALEKDGAGPALMLVDGAFGSRSWGPNVGLAPLLAAHFTVHRYDRRGRGESGEAPPSVEGEIADLAAVLKEAGASGFCFGTSSGANLALRAAAARLPVEKLALWEPNFVVSDSRPPLPLDYVERLNELVGDGRRGDAVEYFMTAAVGLSVEFVAPMREMPMWPALEGAAHTLAFDGTVVAAHMTGTKPAPAGWTTVAAPTLVIDGGTTPWLSEGADAIAAALPDARRRTLAGQQHDVDPNALAPVLIEFFGGE